MALKTLSQLRNGARRRADMEDDGNFVDDPEATDYVNDGIGDLFDLMIDGDSASLFAINAPTLTKVGDNAYSLPSDFYRLVSIDLFVGGRYFSGVPGDVRHLARMASRPPDKREFRYFLRFSPTTGAKQVFVFPELDVANIAIVYLPEGPTLVNDSDTFDGLNMWSEYVEVAAAIEMLIKDEQDTTALEFKLRRLEKRIRDHIRDIDVGLPAQIRDVAHIYEDDRFLRDPLPRP